MNADDAAHIRELIAVNQRRLRKLEVQAAALGAHCPAPILVEIDETRASIALFEEQIDDRVIQSYLEGRKTAHDFVYDLDAIEHKLNQVVVQETRVYRFFGLPVFTVSTVISRVFTLFVVLISLSFVTLLGGFVVQTVVIHDQLATASVIARLDETAQSASTRVAATTTAVAATTATAAQHIAATNTVVARLATAAALTSTTAARTAQVVAATATAQPTSTPTVTKTRVLVIKTRTPLIPTIQTLPSPLTDIPETPVPLVPTDNLLLPSQSTPLPEATSRPRATKIPTLAPTDIAVTPTDMPTDTPVETPTDTPVETPTDTPLF